MQKFIKKNIEVQAIQYTGTPESLEEFETLGLNYSYNDDGTFVINTTKGEVHGVIGDYIMMSVTGEFDICPQDKFEKLYSLSNEVEPVSKADKLIGKCIENYEIEKKKQKVQLVELGIIGILLLLLIILPFVSDVIVKRTIKTTVQYICKKD